jgi:hypothetical protein
MDMPTTLPDDTDFTDSSVIREAAKNVTSVVAILSMVYVAWVILRHLFAKTVAWMQARRDRKTVVQAPPVVEQPTIIVPPSVQ